MAKPKRFYIYRKDPRPWRFHIGPANGIGFVIFQINLAAFIYGLHELAGRHGYISQPFALALVLLAVGGFVCSLVFLTDYSTPYDRE
ncbi:MAG: hypothetical protein AAF996_07405 [Pseudomonadota bacterium]